MPRLPLLLSVLLLLVLPAAAQERAARDASRLCMDPPFSAPEIARIERRADFPVLMDRMALHCPEVAMLFSRWVVGEVEHAPHQKVVRHPPEFLRHLMPDCPVGAVASIPSF